MENLSIFVKQDGKHMLRYYFKGIPTAYFVWVCRHRFEHGIRSQHHLTRQTISNYGYLLEEIAYESKQIRQIEHF